jgi:hypothetical protein
MYGVMASLNFYPFKAAPDPGFIDADIFDGLAPIGIGDMQCISFGGIFDNAVEADGGYCAANKLLAAGVLINTSNAVHLFSFLDARVELGLAVGPVVTKNIETGDWGWGVMVIPLTVKF